MAVVLNRIYRLCVRLDTLKLLAVRAEFRATPKTLKRNTTVASFDDPQVNLLLKRMTLTGKNLDKVLATRRERGIGAPSYKLLTDEQLSKAEHEIEEVTDRYLEMPPVMEERQDTDEIIRKRPELEGYSECKIVFTDISQGTTNRDREILVHEPDGTLRKAHWEERDRMNFMFFQQPGQSYKMPGLLQEENLQNAFNRDGHVDALDLVCAQCEPDSPDYIRVHRQTYQDILSRRSFDLLRSTRHFGGMVYYLTKEKKLTWLLIDMIKRDLISDACDLVRLYHLIHPNSRSAITVKNENLDGLQLIHAYVTVEGPQKLLEFLPEEKVSAMV